MGIQSKAAIALLALIVSSPLAFGQDASSGPPPAPPSAGMNGPAMRRPMHPQHKQWARGGGWQDHDGWRGMHRRGMHRQFMLARLVNNPMFRERIGITPEQAQKIRTQTLNFREQQIHNRANLQVSRLELRDLLSAQNPDRNAIYQKLQEMSTLKLAQAKSAIDFHLDMRAALTPDQQQKLRQMRQDFFQHRFGDRGPQGPMGNMPPQGPSGE